jgi:hypothetical protein
VQRLPRPLTDDQVTTLLGSLRTLRDRAGRSPQGGGGVGDQLGRVAGRARKPDTERRSIERLGRGEEAVLQEDRHVAGQQLLQPQLDRGD